MKALKFIGSSQDDLRDFPLEVRRNAGFELWQIQSGLEPSDWRPMSDVGQGVKEMRIRILGEWRVLYVAAFAETVYVLHCFQKKPTKTRQHDLELARQRYRTIGSQ